MYPRSSKIPLSHFWLNVYQWFQFYQYLNCISIYDSNTLRDNFKQRRISWDHNYFDTFLHNFFIRGLSCEQFWRLILKHVLFHKIGFQWINIFNLPPEISSILYTMNGTAIISSMHSLTNQFFYPSQLFLATWRSGLLRAASINLNTKPSCLFFCKITQRLPLLTIWKN